MAARKITPAKARVAAMLLQHGYTMQQIADSLGYRARSGVFDLLQAYGYDTVRKLPQPSIVRMSDGRWRWMNQDAVIGEMERYNDVLEPLEGDSGG